MLSEVIHSRHSYSAVLLAEQLIHQRSVHSGPLVTFSPISRSADYIFILRQAQDKPLLIMRMLAYYKHKPVPTYYIYRGFPALCKSVLIIKSTTSRYGVKPKILYNSLFVFFFLVT